MGFVEQLLTLVITTLNQVAENQFGAIASGIGTTFHLGATLIIICALINMALQIRPAPLSTMFPIIIKLMLINYFALNWSNFDSIASAVFDFVDRIAGSLIGSITGNNAQFDTIAQQLDNTIEDLSNFGNFAIDNLGYIYGGFIAFCVFVLLGILGCACALIMVMSRIVFTLHLGIAPIMIILSMWGPTKGYFDRWLSSGITFLFYPVIVAGIFSIMIGVADTMIANITGGGGVVIVSQILQAVMLMFVCIVLAYLTGSLAVSMTGNFSLGAVVGAVSSGIGTFSKGGKAMGSEVKTFGSDMYGFSKKPIQNSKDGIMDATDRAARMGQRFKKKIGRR